MMRKVIFISAICLAGFSGCSQEPGLPRMVLRGNAFGMNYDIAYLDSAQKNRKIQVEAQLMIVYTEFSSKDPNSGVSRMAAQGPKFTVEPVFASVLNKTKELYNRTGGVFDPSIGPLLQAWGFGRKPVQGVPDSAVIDSLMVLVDFPSIELIAMDYQDFTKYYLQKHNPGVTMDFSSILTGYAVDAVCNLFDSSRISSYLVRIEGEVRAKGKDENGDLWKAVIEKPVAGEKQVQETVVLDNMGMATAGHYRRFREHNGKRYSDIINPRTGFPVENNMLSATVFSRDCLSADAFAYAFMIMGLEQAFAMASSDPALEAYFIYSAPDGSTQVKYTEGAGLMIHHPGSK